ncbi:MAG: ABC transporter ATP-binding protein [Prochloraceae cyanobacterium]|nr:ABC transporter ATP-binding protein [Prochloraceae cyanobacterium]
MQKTSANIPQILLLSASGLSKSFDGLEVLNNVSISLKPGSITGLIGPNGAGKTTLFNLLCHFIDPDRGEIIFDGQPIHDLQPYQIARKGMVRTFQIARVLARLTVLDNMLLAPSPQTGEQFRQVWFQSNKILAEERENQEKAMFILKSVGLADKARDYAGALSGGQRKLLEIARARMCNPKLLLLDEPTAGVNPILVAQICQHVIDWNKKGISFLIIEHNMDVVMSLCDRIWVLAEGKNLTNGSPEEIQNNPQVLQAYLGN